MEKVGGRVEVVSISLRNRKKINIVFSSGRKEPTVTFDINMFKLNWVDFDTYCPIKLKNSDKYFVFNVAGNSDFDNAGQFEKFTCYPVKQNGGVDLEAAHIFVKEEIQSIPVLKGVSSLALDR